MDEGVYPSGTAHMDSWDSEDELSELSEFPGQTSSETDTSEGETWCEVVAVEGEGKRPNGFSR